MIPRSLSAALAFALVALAPACVERGFVHTNPPPRALTRRAAAEVAVFTTTAPDRPYVEVGLVSARSTTHPPQPKASLIEAAREEAAAQGCDAIIYAPGGTAIAEATCIVFK